MVNYSISIGSGKKQRDELIRRIQQIYRTPNTRGKQRFAKQSYRNCICAFDIETTRLPEIEQSIMYLWQFAVLLDGNEIICVYGRDWNELEELFTGIEDEHLITMVFVHNLSYEFQFLRSHIEIKPEEVFSLKPRKILRIRAGNHMQGNLEFRCSYMQTHKSLDKFLSDSGVQNQKLKDFDYDKRRYPWTELTLKEIEYGCNDVIGLLQAMHKRLADNNDTLYTLPLTSTGYVRREARQAMKQYNYKKLHSMMCDTSLYILLREEFRGGDTHANRYHVGKILSNVASFDRASSYPDVMLNCKFPMTKFVRQGNCGIEDIDRWTKFHKAYVGRFHFRNIRQKDVYYGAPYLTKDKGYCISKESVWDNGRLLSADEYSCTLNDIDFSIVKREYVWDEVEFTDFYTAGYGYLPESLRELVKRLFTDKTSLKGIEGKEIEYALAKELINALYGMSAQNPVKPDIIYSNTEKPFSVEDGDTGEKLAKYNKRAFMLYAWGCWVTAHARQRLKLAVNIAGEDFVYCDTDSCKILITERYPEIKEKFDELNNRLKADSVENGGHATDPKGVEHYLGVYEYEGASDRFITLGAKKYAQEKNGNLEITIAGVGKKKGAEELRKMGGLEALKIGTVFREAGGTESVYNDSDYGYYSPDPDNPDKSVYITRNVVIRPSEYTVGLTLEYLNVLNSADLWHDFLKNTKEKA